MLWNPCKNLKQQKQLRMHKLYQCWGAGSRDFLQGARAGNKVWGAGAVKPYLVGAWAGAGKNPLKTAPKSRETSLFRAGAGKRKFKKRLQGAVSRWKVPAPRHWIMGKGIRKVVTEIAHSSTLVPLFV